MRVWLFLLLCVLPVGAEPVSFDVVPGGAEVVDIDHGDRIIAVGGPDASVTHVSFDSDTNTLHRYAIRRQPYNRLLITLEWNRGLGRWLLRSPQGTLDLMGTPRPLELSRDLRINVVPPDALAYQESPGGNMVDGVPHPVVPVVRTANGQVTIPQAYRPAPIYLVRPGFQPRVLQFNAGDLGNASDTLPLSPVSLSPRYGPFSYRGFNMALMAVIITGGLAWVAFVLPRARIRRRHALLQSSIVRQVDHAAQRTDGQLRSWVGARLPTVSAQTYILLELLGRGGYGAVFAAAALYGDGVGPSLWAVKLLLVDDLEDMDQRFLREVRVCSRLQHPGIVKIVDWGFWQAGTKHPLPFIVFEKLTGHTLRDDLDRLGGRADADTVVRWAREVLRALGTAHDQGIVHRDIKPDNLMVLDSGHLKIMDFGIAREIDMSLTRTGQYVGTPRYMSPEQFSGGDISAATDIYSLGTVMYQALAGVPPFDQDHVWAQLAAMQSGAREPLLVKAPDTPPALAAVVEKMLAYDPVDRYLSTAEVLQALSGC